MLPEPSAVSAQEPKQPDALPKGDTFSSAFDKSKVFPGTGRVRPSTGSGYADGAAGAGLAAAGSLPRGWIPSP
jgi:hypothetical protein